MLLHRYTLVLYSALTSQPTQTAHSTFLSPKCRSALWTYQFFQSAQCKKISDLKTLLRVAVEVFPCIYQHGMKWSFLLEITSSSCYGVLWEQELVSWESGKPKCGHRSLQGLILSWCRADGEAAGITTTESNKEVDGPSFVWANVWLPWTMEQPFASVGK